jgi:hypothetical protein
MPGGANQPQRAMGPAASTKVVGMSFAYADGRDPTEMEVRA